MDDGTAENSAPSEEIFGAESFAEHARRRAEMEREAVEWAIDELERAIDERKVDLDPLLEYGRRSRESLPDHHLRIYETMAAVFDVDPEVYDVYVFAYSDLCEELADASGRSEKNPKGCTNVLVAPPKVDPDGGFGVGPTTEPAGSIRSTGSAGSIRSTEPAGSIRSTGSAGTDGATVDTEGEGVRPLVLKNRDIAGRGTRPKAIIEQPPIDGYNGILTVDTCGTISLFKGVNDRGLVAANTYIDRERDDVEPEERLRNGTLIRMLLEECDTVGEARELIGSHPTRRLSGQTLFLADATDAVLLEIDPVAERIAVEEGPIVTRTNHFVNSASTQTESSSDRRARALELLEGADRIGRDDLWKIAADHANGPGDDSICRHPEPETDRPHAFGQLTTASASIFEGGSPVIEVGMGNPCGAGRTRCAFGDEIPADLRTGRRWLDRLH